MTSRSAASTKVVLEGCTVDHIDPAAGETADLILHLNIIEQCDPSRRIELDQDIAVRRVVTARDRTEERGVPDIALT
jgi:hypothetical protein